MEILNKEGDQNMSNGFLTLEQLQQYSIQEIGENVIGEFENVKEQFGKFFKESQDMKNNKYDLLRQESILLQFHKKQKNDKKIYNHEEIVDFLSGFKISIPQNTIAKEKKQIQSHFDIENLTEQKIFGRIIQNLDYKNKSIYNVSTDEREEFQELKNIFMNHLGIKNNKRSKRKQLKEFEKISEKYNKKFLEEMKLDYEVVDIGQKILDSLQDIRNEQKRICEKIFRQDVLQQQVDVLYNILIRLCFLIFAKALTN
ncbi:hypothetical protein TTHERM_000277610 (macronuclear) [Tetrahymena thermophila SB210]|uniref:Uncharacterized protein n=1 Tax=Tetrahymena thermophila (strain SB210) TaxID=312017 RepID=W7XJ48_TETTS|nr:hypothetical protein TTHERM_000277610 [Tetrahymena thermophila SB210]EWS73849.1 hypothetical protein TTHERM_000277610 [Tetrahymena thermophila SB210]|eukprot:XP_012653596.1 hypothetical protein TTHERM_000277610 [Tetrahymena thermophila SB210]